MDPAKLIQNEREGKLSLEDFELQDTINEVNQGN